MGVKGYLVVSSLLFGLGVYGALARRHVIAVLIGLELMFSAAALNFVTFSRLHPAGQSTAGQIFAVFIITVAAAETIVGLALVLSLHRSVKSAQLDQYTLLKW